MSPQGADLGARRFLGCEDAGVQECDVEAWLAHDQDLTVTDGAEPAAAKLHPGCNECKPALVTIDSRRPQHVNNLRYQENYPNITCIEDANSKPALVTIDSYRCQHVNNLRYQENSPDLTCIQDANLKPPSDATPGPRRRLRQTACAASPAPLGLSLTPQRAPASCVVAQDAVAAAKARERMAKKQQRQEPQQQQPCKSSRPHSSVVVVASQVATVDAADDVVLLEEPVGDRSVPNVHGAAIVAEALPPSNAAAAAGLRGLLGRRRTAKGVGSARAAGCEESMEHEGVADTATIHSPSCPGTAAASVVINDVGTVSTRVLTANRLEPPAPVQGTIAPMNEGAVPSAAPHCSQQRASWTGSTGLCAPLTASTGGLVDRLYDECLARGGGRLRGAAELRRVLLDLSGQTAANDGSCGGEPEHLRTLLQGLGQSLDAEVSRAQFQGLVQDALALRQSQEIECYEQGSIKDLPREGVQEDVAQGVHMSHTGLKFHPSVANSCSRQWEPLPSWSMELRLSAEARVPQAELPTAAECWHGVEGALDRLCSNLPPDLEGEIARSLQDLRSELAAFARSFVNEARSRLRSAHASSARLLDQRKRLIDELSSQLEERDAELQRKAEEHAGLASRLRAAQASAAHAEGLAEAAARAEAAAVAKAAATVNDKVPGWQLRHREAEAMEPQSPQQSTATVTPNSSSERLCTREVSVMQARLDAVEAQRDAAEASCKALEQQLESLSRSYEEDARTFHAGCAQPNFNSSLTASTARELMRLPNPLAFELQDVAQNSALQRAEEAEAALREELREARGQIQRQAEDANRARKTDDAAAAAEASLMQDRLAQMHAGTWFDKVAFRRQVRQERFVRLSFDLQRIEWGQSQQGPMKVLPVAAIIRVDYGDASRSFRCFEYGRPGKPEPGFCLSISTPSRSLDLIASCEHEVEAWLLGLNEVVPYRPERQRFTTHEFFLRRSLLRLEFADGHGGSGDLDPESEDDAASAGTGAGSRGMIKACTGMEHMRNGMKRLMPGYRGR